MSEEVEETIPDEPLDGGSARLVLAQWSAASHSGLGPEHVALFRPPGPEGLTAFELARRLGAAQRLDGEVSAGESALT